MTRSVQAFHRETLSHEARRHEIVIWPKADHTWTRVKKGGRRIVSRETARVWKRLSPCWAWEHFARNTVHNYGCLLAVPHEAFTSNTCMWCLEFHKARRVQRHRKCPNQACVMYWGAVHGDLPAVLNMVVAAAAQAAIRLGRPLIPFPLVPPAE